MTAPRMESLAVHPELAMSSNSFPLRRPPGFHEKGRVTWIEKTADILGVNRIFLRRPPLRIDAAENEIISPAHSKVETLSTISPQGEVEEKSVLGKRRTVLLKDLLKDESLVSGLLGGEYVKLYLAPWDLHFLVFPTAGSVGEHEYRPGWAVPLVFMKRGDVLNERLCITIQTEWGFPIVLVMIGSWMVNGIHHTFESGRRYERGDDLGYFKVGSSVILAFPPRSIRWLCRTGDKLQIGSPLAQVL